MPITVANLDQFKANNEKFTCLTCYDASMAKLMDDAGIELILVGDTLGQVIQGHDTTLPVKVSDIVYHIGCVSRASQNPLIIGDMPFMSFATSEDALSTAKQFMQAGAHMVKMEGGRWLAETVKRISDCGIPVCAHLGLTPQSVNQFGGYKVQGKTQDAATRLIEDAKLLQEAGARMLVLECIPQTLAAEVTSILTIPTMGIGAGAECDGQVLVLYDMLGVTAKVPRFVQNFLTPEAPSISAAISAYVASVKNKTFPGEEHVYR